VSEDSIKRIDKGSYIEKINKLRTLLKESYSGTKPDSDQKSYMDEIQGHINNIKSINGRIKHEESAVSFYVSQDPFEILQMGTYFGSCLSFGKDSSVKSHVSVYHVMNANQSVIYAKAENGKYVGRNRIALTDSGILCTRFYQNGNLSLDGAWIDYLSSYGNHAKQDILIPTNFLKGIMKQELNKHVEDGKIEIKEMEVNIEPGYFSNFFGDGISVRNRDGKLWMKSDMCVLKHNGSD